MIFVFGSNLAGRHGKGAALEAKNKWGAVYGVGRGRTGSAYALPTKDKNLKTLSYTEVLDNIIEFYEYARSNPDEWFMFTPVGTGLAGFKLDTIILAATMLHPPSNVLFTKDWIKYKPDEE